MRQLGAASIIACAALALAVGLAPAIAQPKGPAQPPAQPPVAPAKPYNAVPITLAAPMNDASLAAFRKELTNIIAKKDRAALAARIVSKGFFWDRGDGKGADPKKSGIDNLSAAIDVSTKDSPGWDQLAAAVNEASAAPAQGHAGAVCAPAPVKYDDKVFQQVVQATGTDASEWGYPSAAGIEMREKADAKSPVIEKLGMHLIRVMDDGSGGGEWVRVVAPSGKTGFVRGEQIMSLANDQLCFIKEGNAWKIAGVVGGGGGD